MRACPRKASLRSIRKPFENMSPANHERRREERVCAALPVHMGTATGTTHDVSATGMYFETDAVYARGSEIRFTVEFDTPGGKMRLNCNGEIVRIEPHERQAGLAVKIIDSMLEPVIEMRQASKGT